jgi:glycosyltransferase involved in cell wall biosynthesis
VQIQPGPAGENDSAVDQIRAIAPDVFHSFSCRRNANDVITAAAAAVPVILTNRDSVRFWDPALQRQDWEAERNAATQRITACSDAVAATARAVENLSADKIVTIHNGVALVEDGSTKPDLKEELRIPSGSDVLGFAATYRSIKGHEVLLHAFREVAARRPRTHLVCCGEEYDDTRQRLQQLAGDLGVEDRVTLLGVRKDVGQFYQVLTVYTHPSFSEGFSNAILEAMAHGLPVVATQVGGTPECVVEGVTGMLVPPGESEPLANAILALLEDVPRRERIAAAGQSHVRKGFSIPAMVRGYEDLYLSLL